MARPCPSRPSSSRPIVLLVDGHEATLALYGIALLGMGFDVVFAKDDSQAQLRARALRPDIIATEVPMGGGAGAFLRHLKRDVSTRDIPVVAFSGCLRQDPCERAEGYGFAAFFATPCLPDALAAGLRQVLEGNRPLER